MDYLAKLISTDRFGMDKRKVGDLIYVHLFNDGKVLLYSPHDRKAKLPVFDVILDNVEEAKKYATCISKTDLDVKGAWDKMMSDRYW